jgi:hypothetical protein
MTHNTEAVEATRTRFRPERIMTLFVGESAPASGDFFYYGNNAMLSHMRNAVQLALGNSKDFLATFKAYGWYLDDLVLEPVDKLSPAQRKLKCLDAQASLANRIAEYQPLAIVTLLLRVRDVVEAASIAANCSAPRFAVPFPGMSNQRRFKDEMAKIIPALPRAPDGN